MIEYPKAADTPVSHLPFSPATRVGDLVFVSGQASVDATGKIVPDTFEGEMRRSIENLAKVLADSGSDLAHVVQTRNYVRDADDFPPSTGSIAISSSSPIRRAQRSRTASRPPSGSRSNAWLS